MDPRGREGENGIEELEPSPPSYLNNLVCPRGQEPSSGGIEVYVNYVVLAVVESSCGRPPEGRDQNQQKMCQQEAFECFCKPPTQQTPCKLQFETFPA